MMKTSSLLVTMCLCLLLAAHARAIEVTTNADAGGGSLRAAIAAASPGETITFAAALSGQTITLTGGQLVIGTSLTIDASSLPAGITIDANHASRVMQIGGGTTVVLHSLALINGRASDGVDGADDDGSLPAVAGAPGENGGGIHNSGTLTLTSCTLSGNRTGNGGKGGDSNPFIGFGAQGGAGGAGGGIWNSGVLTATECIFSSNATGDGGNGGNCLNNSFDAGYGGAGGAGGGIWNSGGITLDSCTFTGNQTGNGGDGGTSESFAFGGHGGAGGGGAGFANFSPGTGNYTITCTFTNNLTGNGGAGGSGAPGNGGDGGGIQTFGVLNVLRCTLNGNMTGIGGDIGSGGSRGGSGGAIHNAAGSITPACVVNTCTIYGNQTGIGGNGGLGGDGGGIHNIGKLLVTKSTISQNQTVGGGQGGGFSAENYGGPTIDNTIIANNSAVAGPDVRLFTGTIFLTGVNLVSSTDGSSFAAGANLIVDPAPLLAPLGDNGGPTLTVLLLAGSPAIDAAGTTDPGGTDQRGLPRFVNGALDIGAVEIQDETDDFALDTDGDGYPNGVEQAIGSNPGVFDPAHPNKLQLGFNGGGDPTFTFGYEDDTIVLKLTRSTDLIDFPTIIATASGLSLQNFTDTNPPSGGKAFYRLEATRP